MSTPPLFHVPAVSLRSDVVVLDGAEGRHAARVRRIRPGERVLLSDGAGALATCDVTDAERDTLTCAVVERRTVPPPEPRLVVVQALAKGDRAEQAVETMTEAGVDEVVPWQAERCVVRWRDDRAERSVQRWRATAAEAAKQSRRAWTPVVPEVMSTSAVLERLAAASLAAVLDADRGEPVSAVDVPATGDVVLVVGPEGGVSPAETDAFSGAGVRFLRLGPTVLRSATAGTVAAAALLSRTGRWA